MTSSIVLSQRSWIDTARVSASRLFFLLAVIVVGIAFYAPDFSRMGEPEIAWSPEEIEQAETTGEERVVVRELAYLSLLGIATWAIFTKAGPRLVLRGPLIALTFLFVGWCLLSVIWSEDPATSLKRWIQLACIFVAALGLGRQLSTRGVCLLVLTVFGGYVLLGLGAELMFGAFHPWSEGYRFSGGEHPNTQGGSCLLVCLAAVAMLGDRRWPARRSVAVLLLTVPILVLTGSRTAFISAVAAMLVYWLLRVRFLDRLFLALALPALALMTGLVLSLSAPGANAEFSELLLLGRQEDAASMTGRLPLWNELWRYVEQRPITGYGYGGFWTVERKAELFSRLDYAAPCAHNASLETLLHVGFVGAAIFWMIALMAWWRAAKGYAVTHDNRYAFWLLMFTACAVNSITEAVLPLWGSMTLLMGIGIVQMSNDFAQQRAPT